MQITLYDLLYGLMLRSRKWCCCCYCRIYFWQCKWFFKFNE
jgi:hypothetical protein